MCPTGLCVQGRSFPGSFLNQFGQFFRYQPQKFRVDVIADFSIVADIDQIVKKTLLDTGNHIVDGHHLTNKFGIDAGAELNFLAGHAINFPGKGNSHGPYLVEFPEPFFHIHIPDVAHQGNLVGKVLVECHFTDMGLPADLLDRDPFRFMTGEKFFSSANDLFLFIAAPDAGGIIHLLGPKMVRNLIKYTNNVH